MANNTDSSAAAGKAAKMRKRDYWPALVENEKKALAQQEIDAERRKQIYAEDCIKIRGANEHNLKGISLSIPRNQLVVLTGLSGSGKSSLAFDTIYAEGQRRYMESLSSYARQFLGQMEKPDVENIEGLSPAISIDQKSTNRNPRSTVVVGMNAHGDKLPAEQPVGHPFDLIGIHIGGVKLNGGRQVDNHGIFLACSPLLKNSLTDIMRELNLSPCKALG